MKSCEQMTESLLRRRDEYLQKKRQKAKRIKAVCTSAVCICAAVFIGIGVYKIAGEIYANNQSKISPQGIQVQTDESNHDVSHISQKSSTVLYESLALPDDVSDSLAADMENGVYSMASLASFSEDMISEADAVIEGTVTSRRFKQYRYDTYSDKFEENGIMHEIAQTIVYEITINSVIKGSISQGQSIMVESNADCYDLIYPLKANHRYVLPLDVLPDKLNVTDYAGGDIDYEGDYYIIYPYHEQIEITNDGKYIVANGWKSLIKDETQKVIKKPELESTLELETEFYLLDGGVFKKRLNALLGISNAIADYNLLDLPDDPNDIDLNSLHGIACMDIARFSESNMKGCAAVVEGTVISRRIKECKYDVQDGDDILHNYYEAFVYELKINKTWAGENLDGWTVTVEDAFFGIEQPTFVKTNHRYIIPLHYVGDIVRGSENYVTGKIKRVGEYETCYPYHEQIEITNDGKYIVTGDWDSLIADDVRQLYYLNSDGEKVYSTGAWESFLLEKDEFERKFSALLDKWL